MVNHLLTFGLLLLMPVSPSQDLPDAYYQLPLEVREKATIVITGTYVQGRGPCIWRPDGIRIWPMLTWFRITKVYQGKVGGKTAYVKYGRLPKDKYVSTNLENDRKYLVLLRPSEASQKALAAGEYVPAWDAMADEEIVAIVPLDR